MEIIEFKYNDDFKNKEEIALCLGAFDSFHLGHVQIIKKALKSGYKTALMTFDNNPKTILGYREKNQSILSLSDKRDLLEEMGVDFLYIFHLMLFQRYN